MKSIILAALYVLVASCTFGQKSLGIKIYQNTDLFSIEYREWGNSKPTVSEEVNFNRISLAASLQTKSKFVHEVELFIPEISKPLDKIQYPMNYELRRDETFDGEVSSYSFRYEFSKTFTDDTKRLGFGLGAGINPYYVHIEYIPNVETTFYFSSRLYGFVVNVTPRISYRLSNRFSIDLNVPLKIYDLRWEKIRVDNPAIPITQQTVTTLDNIFFEDAYTIRLGVMYTLTK